MEQSKYDKFRAFVEQFIMRICGHEHGCCDHISRRCSKCPIIIKEKAHMKTWNIDRD